MGEQKLKKLFHHGCEAGIVDAEGLVTVAIRLRRLAAAMARNDNWVWFRYAATRW